MKKFKYVCAVCGRSKRAVVKCMDELPVCDIHNTTMVPHFMVIRRKKC